MGPRQDGPVDASTCVGENLSRRPKKWLPLFTGNICGAFEQLLAVFTCKTAEAELPEENLSTKDGTLGGRWQQRL